MLTNEINLDNVRWNTDGSAEVQTSYGTIKIYKIQTAVNYKLQEYCGLIIRNIWKLQHGDTSFLGSNIFCPISFVVPPIITSSIPIVYKELQQIVTDFMENKLEDVSHFQLEDNSITNTQFIMLLGTKRDYSCNCSVCHTNNIHEPIILRPCGHSICATPCMQILSKNKTFKCPTCDELVLKTFSQHDVAIPDTWKVELESIAKHFSSSKMSISGGKYILSNIL